MGEVKGGLCRPFPSEEGIHCPLFFSGLLGSIYNNCINKV